MNMKLRLLAAFAVLGMTPYAMTGCGGTECGEGTTEQDGQCVAPTTGESITCADGTTLNEGKCEADISDCGDGTSLVDGACVADEGPDPSESCGSGTQYDEGVGACVPTSTIECGDGTVEQDGSCVAEPQDSTCQAGTKLADDGSCVVDMAACGDKTQLDPNSNTCLATDEVCGANTAYDADSDSCVPTDAVCDAGTVYSMETGLCLPEATCKAGDVILNGNCVSPVEEAIANADFTSQEAMDPVANNDDVLNGGTANALTIPAMGTVVAAGEIGTPVDLDGDMRLDQDVDAYTFSATAGQTLQVSVQPTAGPSLAFAVVANGGINALIPEEFYLRFSPFGVNSGASRSIVIPEDGDYTIVVAPAVYMSNGFEGIPSGNDNWKYALRVEDIAPYVATDVDTSVAPITGEFTNLSDNLFKLTNYTGGLATFTVDDLGEDVQGATLQVQTANGVFGTFNIFEGDEEQLLLPQGDVYFFFDWRSISGRDVVFEVSVTPETTDGDLGLISAGTPVNTTPADYAGDETRIYTFAVAAGDVVEFSHTNTEGEEIDVVIRDAAGNSVFTDTFFDVSSDSTPDVGFFYSPTGGDYILEVTNNSTADALTAEVITINAITPTSLGMFGIGDMVSSTDATTISEEHSLFFTMDVTADASFDFTLEDNGGSDDLDIFIYDAITAATIYSGTATGDEGSVVTLATGSYLVRIEADDEVVAGYNFNGAFNEPPLLEVEPNDTIAEATVIPDLTKPIAGVSHTITGTDVDWFSFTVTTPDVYLLEWASDADFCFDITLHDDAGNLLSDEGAFLTAGTYLIKIDGSCSFTNNPNPYVFSIVPQNAVFDAIDADGNDTFATATAATNVTSVPFDIGGIITSDVDEDWYQVTFGAATTGQVFLAAADPNIDGPNANMTVEVYDSTGATLLTPTDGLYDFPAGVVYLKVTGFSTTGSGNSYTLRATPGPDFVISSAPALAIPDGDTAGTMTTLNVPQMCTLTDIQVDMNITHTWRGDITLTLIDPTGAVSVILHNRSGSSADDIIGTYPTSLTPNQPLANFNGLEAMGDWTLFVSDSVGGDVGTVNNWGLKLYCQ